MTFQRDPEQNETKHLRKFVDVAGKRVLEVGCGDGRLTWRYAADAAHVSGIDTDRDGLRVAMYDRPQDLETKVHFSEAPAEHLPFRAETFDIALLSWSLCCIEHEGMLDALREIHRVLAPGGVWIDLRALSDPWHMEICSAREVLQTGSVSELPHEPADDEAANQAASTAESNGWFRRERETLFPIYYVWDTPGEMEEWLEDEWENSVELNEETKRATRSAWAVSDGDSQVRMNVKMLITRWRKLK